MDKSQSQICGYISYKAREKIKTSDYFPTFLRPCPFLRIPDLLNIDNTKQRYTQT